MLWKRVRHGFERILAGKILRDARNQTSGTLVLVLLILMSNTAFCQNLQLNDLWLPRDARSQCPGLQQPVQRILLR